MVDGQEAALSYFYTFCHVSFEFNFVRGYTQRSKYKINARSFWSLIIHTFFRFSFLIVEIKDNLV
jgi:hypothetical protein